MSNGEDGEEEKFTSCRGGGTWEFIKGDGKEGGYGEGAGDLSSADWDSKPVFANIRAVKGLDRFTLRGKSR